jgi:hypothetical protein
MDAALAGSLRAEGIARGRAVVFSSGTELKKVSANFALTMANGAPRWKFSGVEATQGTDSFTGEGSSQADGKLALELTGAGRTVHASE